MTKMTKQMADKISLSRRGFLITGGAAATGRVINIKKAQFMAPDDIAHAVAKVRDAGNSRVTVTERGSSFGVGRFETT